MKTIIYILSASLILISCDGSQSGKKNETEKDSLQAVLQKRDSAVKTYLTIFSDVGRTLDSINVREKSIYLKTEKPSDLKKSTIINDINNEIKAINDLIKRNSHKIAQLNSELKSGEAKNKQLEEAIRTLNTQISQKEDELATLHSKLTKLNLEVFKLEVTIGVLYAENEIKDEAIEAVTEELYTAFYITGTSRELEKSDIIDKKGGLLGMGKTSGLNNDFDASKFTSINYTETTTIPLNCKKADIVTSHPTNAYRFEKDKGMITKLIITNAEDFWKASKYLVVVKEN